MNNDSATRRTGPLEDLSLLAHRSQYGTRIDANGTNRAQQADMRRVGFIEDLIRQIDMIIYCQISVLYYMDCSLWRLMLRLLPQWFLSSKQAVPSSVSQVNRTYFISIIFTYLVCTLLHAVLDPPRGDELSRGYIHGSFLTDFVGEPAPVPKGKMLLVDFCVLALQLLLLAAVLEKQDLKFLIVDPVLMTDTNARFGSTNLQDLDAEEQGIRRSQEGNVNEESVEEDGALDDLMTDRHFLDESYGGRMMIVTLNLSSVVSKAWRS